MSDLWVKVLFIFAVLPACIAVCPGGFFGFLGKCYFYNTQLLNWNGANARCGQINSTLVVVETDAMLGRFTQQAQDDVQSIWTAGMINSGGSWLWNVGGAQTPLSASYDRWLVNHPQNQSQHCIAVGLHGRWLEVDCTTTLRSFCQHRWLRPTAAAPDYTSVLQYYESFTPYHPDIPEIRFSCSLELVNTGLTFSNSRFTQLHVTWFADGVMKKNGTVSSLPAEIHEYEWIDILDTDGRSLTCEISAFDTVRNTPVTYTTSPYFAGIKAESHSMRVQEGSKDTIRVYTTLPIICPAYDPNCQLTFTVDVQEDENNTAICADGSLQKQLVFEHDSCEWGISGEAWWEGLEVPVSATLDGQYDGDATVNVTLHTELESTHLIWSNHKLPVIQVTAFDQTTGLSGKRCNSINDPHMLTFDGKGYENHLEGEFILYRHKEMPVEVRTWYKKCGSIPACNCAAAVRTGPTVFLVDTCGQRFRMGLTGDENNAMRIEESLGGKQFKVYTPSGSVVEITVSGRYLNVVILPSEADGMSVEGLCGDFNGNCADDMMLSTGVYSTAAGAAACPNVGLATPPNDFSASWRVPSNHSLYGGVWNDNLLWPPVAGTPQQGSAQNSTLKSYCDCSKQKGFTSNCDASKRSTQCVDPKKKLRGGGGFKPPADYVVDTPPVFEPVDPANFNNLAPPPTPTWTNGWTATTAKTYCEDKILNSTIGKMCANIPGVDLQAAVEHCEEDIFFTGDTVFVVDSIDNLRSRCESELRRNTSLWDVNNGTRTIPVAFLEAACPNDCFEFQGQGNCVRGNCTCVSPWEGEDCGIDGSTPPEVWGTPSDGLCDMDHRPCQSTQIYGNNFIDGPGLDCLVDTFDVYDGGSTRETGMYQLDATFYSFAEVGCPLQAPRRGRRQSVGVVMRGYNISLTNNGVLFSTPVQHLVYNSACQVCNATLLTCTIKPNTCFIDGNCYLDNQRSPSSQCEYCIASLSQNYWTYNNTDAVSCEAEEGLSSSIIAAIAVCVSVAVLVLVALLLLYFFRSRKTLKAVETEKPVSVPPPPTVLIPPTSTARPVNKQKQREKTFEREPTAESLTDYWRPSGSVFRVKLQS